GAAAVALGAGAAAADPVTGCQQRERVGAHQVADRVRVELGCQAVIGALLAVGDAGDRAQGIRLRSAEQLPVDLIRDRRPAAGEQTLQGLGATVQTAPGRARAAAGTRTLADVLEVGGVLV